jgi:prophage regulatory protein
MIMYIARNVQRGRCLSISNAVASHAGGPSYKGTATTKATKATKVTTKDTATAVSPDCAIESTGAGGTTVAAAGDDDDGGGGDGDPDSDRAPRTSPKPRYTAALQTALDRKRVTTSSRILRMAELKIRISLSRSTIYEMMASGDFPRSVSLGPRAVGWLESDIEAWLDSRINASTAA